MWLNLVALWASVCPCFKAQCVGRWRWEENVGRFSLVCMWVAITVTLAFVHSSSSLQKLCPQFGLYLHAVQPIWRVKSPPHGTNYSLTPPILPLHLVAPFTPNVLQLRDKQDVDGWGKDRQRGGRGVVRGTKAREEDWISERAARGEKEGRMQCPSLWGIPFFWPFHSRTVSHQSLCLPLISRLRDLAPDRPLTVWKEAWWEKAWPSGTPR